MAELADAHVRGACGAILGGSSPLPGTWKGGKMIDVFAIIGGVFAVVKDGVVFSVRPEDVERLGLREGCSVNFSTVREQNAVVIHDVTSRGAKPELY